MAQTFGNVLVADDDAVVAEALCAWLQRQGYCAHQVRTGRDAITALEEGSFDLILLDLDMPDNEDLAVVRERRGEAELVPVIILTGAATLESAIAALRLGVADYVRKPPDLDELRIRIAHAIRRGRAMRTLIDRGRPETSAWTTWLNTISAPTMPARATAPPTNPMRRSLPDTGLSARELEVARAIAEGHRPTDIAQRLNIATNTVRSHLKSAFRKLGVHSQVELVARLGELLRASSH